MPNTSEANASERFSSHGGWQPLGSEPPAPAQHPEPQQVTIHIPAPAPTQNAIPLFAIGDLVEVASRKYAPGGVFEVTEMEGDKLTIRGPEGHTTPAHFLVPAAQCEVVF